MKVAAIVPAAGKGNRLKSKIEKPYVKIGGKPILARTLLRLSNNSRISEIIVAVNGKNIDKLKRGIIDRYRIKKVKFTTGGKRRPASVFNALKTVSRDIDYVLIHDCARPFINDRLISSSLRAARRFGASVVAVPVKPTLKYVKNRYIKYTPDRKDYWEAQTPQVFRRELIENAYRNLRNKSFKVTDDSMLVEKMGVKVKVIMGSYANIKITTREDLELAELFTSRGL